MTVLIYDRCYGQSGRIPYRLRAHLAELVADFASMLAQRRECASQSPTQTKIGPNQKVGASHNREASRLEDVGSEDPFPGIAPGTLIPVNGDPDQENSKPLLSGDQGRFDTERFCPTPNAVVNL